MNYDRFIKSNIIFHFSESILNRCFPSSAVDASLSLVGDVGNTLVESAFSAASLKAECEDAGDVIDVREPLNS